MKLLFQVEGRTDEAVLKHFVELTLGFEIETILTYRRPGGWQAALRTLTPALQQAWKDKDCLGAVVVIDADDSIPHDQHGPEDARECRTCAIRSARFPQQDRSGWAGSFRVAVGVPVQSIEAWLLHFGYAIDRRSSGPPQRLHRREAKRLLYGSVSPAPSAIDWVLERLLPRIDMMGLDSLAGSQPSFAHFRREVVELRAGYNPSA